MSSKPMRAWAPGRVNLIGEHTDYTGGLVFPMAIDLGTSIEFEPLTGRIDLESSEEPGRLPIYLPVNDPSDVTPKWGRYVAAVAAEMRATVGLAGSVHSTLPLGSGLSSSAALEVATAIALGVEGTSLEIAELCRRAELAATGVPCGIMDQLTSIGGVEDHALLIDCRSLEIEPTPMPPDAQVVVVHSGQHRRLATSAYGDRRAETEAAESIIGPLRDATIADVALIQDARTRRRARHVVSENQRVSDFATALVRGDLIGGGALMRESHESLRTDFEVSTGGLDDLVETLCSMRGVHGARLTGAGFGGCVVALCDVGTDVGRGWPVRASRGAHLS